MAVTHEPAVWSWRLPARPTSVDVLTDGRGAEYVVPTGELVDEWCEGIAELRDAFAELATYADDDAADAVARFVETFGLPELCRHGRPDTHPGNGRCCHPAVWPGTEAPCVEVRTIRRASRAVDAVLALVESLPMGRGMTKDQRMAMQLWPGRITLDIRAVEQQPRAAQRQFVAEWLTGTMRACGIAPLIRWEAHRRPEIHLEASGLLGLLLVEVARAAGMAGERTYQCAVCNGPVTPNRAPKPGEAVYCSRKASTACQRERLRRNAMNSRRARANNGGSNGR